MIKVFAAILFPLVLLVGCDPARFCDINVDLREKNQKALTIEVRNQKEKEFQNIVAEILKQNGFAESLKCNKYIYYKNKRFKKFWIEILPVNEDDVVIITLSDYPSFTRSEISLRMEKIFKDKLKARFRIY